MNAVMQTFLVGRRLISRERGVTNFNLHVDHELLIRWSNRRVKALNRFHAGTKTVALLRSWNKVAAFPNPDRNTTNVLLYN